MIYDFTTRDLNHENTMVHWGKMGKLGRGRVDCWKTVAPELASQHSLCLGGSSSRRKKTLNKDFGKIYPSFHPAHFTPSEPTLPPVDPIQ